MIQNIKQFCLKQAQTNEIYQQIYDNICDREHNTEELQNYIMNVREFLNPNYFEAEQEIENYKQNNNTSRTSMEDPKKKCRDYLSFLDCSCKMPTYILQFLELVADQLEIGKQNELKQQILKKSEGDYIFRELPISASNIQNILTNKKKHNLAQKKEQYKQVDVTTRIGSILRFEDIKQFKRFCQEIWKQHVDGKFQEYKFASFTAQDFRFLPLMYKTVYNIQIPTFTKNDIEYIVEIYYQYCYIFNREYRINNIYKNTKKTMNIIKQIIIKNKQLYDKYNQLFQFIIDESQSIKQVNQQIFDEIYQKIKIQ